MKTITTTILVAAASIAGVSCKKDTVGHGPLVTETRAVQHFTGIDLQMNGNVYYTVGTERKVEITARQSIHSLLETTIIDNRLVLRYRNGKTYDADESIRIDVTAPAPSSLFLNTSGSIYVMNDLQVSEVMLRAWGSGSIFLQKVKAGHIDAETTVSGRIIAAGGEAISEKLKTKGSGGIDLSAIAAKTVVTQTIGSGDIKVRVSENLDVTINGSGDVYFSGYPYISTHISGTGRLVRY